MPFDRSKMTPVRAYPYWTLFLLALGVVARECTGTDALGAALFAVGLFLTGWRIAFQYERDAHRVSRQRAWAVTAAGELLRVASRTTTEILRDLPASEPLHVARAEAVRRFFRLASDLNLTKDEMLLLVSSHDPIVIRDVVNDLFDRRDPEFDPKDERWRTAVHYYANRHSDLVHRPIDLKAWARAIPLPDDVLSRK